MAEGSDFLHLDPATAPARDRTGWLTSALREALADGRLARGDRLPPTRTLASDLALSRGVVVEAYRRLADEGLVSGRTAAGTVVTGVVAAAAARRPTGTQDLPGAADRLPDVRHRDGGTDLSPGRPDLSAFPRSAWLRAERAVLAEAGVDDLSYGDPRGVLALREQLSSWLARTRGVRVGPDGLVVVAGVAQALALLGHVLLARGTAAIAVEDPGSRGAREQLRHWGFRTPAVPVDDDGLVSAALPPDVDAVLVTPAHQFPTGVPLAPHRRRELLAWAAAGEPGRRLVVEDDYDAEHRYDRAPVPALQASAPGEVAHTGSTSKTLAPGMRLGWLAPPPHLLPDVVATKHASDLGCPAVPQLVLARLLADGTYDRHLRRVRVRQRARRDAVVAALQRFSPGTEVAGVAAGMHLLVLLDDGCDDVEVAARAAEAGVVVHPLSWHRTTAGRPGLVLGYAAHPPDRLVEAVRALAGVLPAAVSARSSGSGRSRRTGPAPAASGS